MAQDNPGGSRRTGDDTDDLRGTTSRTEQVRVDSPVTRAEVIRPGAGAERGLGTYKTSAAAAFALVFGVSALICAVTAILSPLAVLFGLIAVVLGIVGMSMARRPGVTGRGVAIGGLVTGLIGLLLGGLVIGGATYFLNDEKNIDRIENRLNDLRDDLPQDVQIPKP